MKSYWEQITADRTTGPDTPLFKGLKDNWHNVNKDCKLTRFDWAGNRGSWLESQALEAKNQLRMLVKTEVFKNS